jgi:hypothetical protein
MQLIIEQRVRLFVFLQTQRSENFLWSDDSCRVRSSSKPESVTKRFTECSRED